MGSPQRLKEEVFISFARIDGRRGGMRHVGGEDDAAYNS